LAWFCHPGVAGSFYNFPSPRQVLSFFLLLVSMSAGTRSLRVVKRELSDAVSALRQEKAKKLKIIEDRYAYKEELVNLEEKVKDLQSQIAAVIRKGKNAVLQEIREKGREDDLKNGAIGLKRKLQELVKFLFIYFFSCFFNQKKIVESN
jgi:seryl-tRNA synthetase